MEEGKVKRWKEGKRERGGGGGGSDGEGEGERESHGNLHGRMLGWRFFIMFTEEVA